jgi:myo-inositol-hexaphosphate 3-phosphohydrolase
VRIIRYRPSRDGTGQTPLTLAEGLRVDDTHGALYVGEESFGLLRYGAQPDKGTVGTVVDRVVSEDGRILEDVEGITIVRTDATRGYIIVSGQNDDDPSRFEVYDRETNAYLHSIAILPDSVDDGIPGASATDGIYGYFGFVSDRFPHGMFIVHSDSGTGEVPSLLLVRYEDIWPEDIGPAAR